MGGCASCAKKEGNRNQNMQLAHRIFMAIDKKKEGVLNVQNLSQYFTQYTETSVGLIRKEIDLNQDGVITKSQWLAYWQYVRLAGYNDKVINKSLKKIEQGIAHLGFSGAASYQIELPRETLIKGIEQKLKQDPAVLPFMLEPS